jgi:predicted trehalose synthase
MNEKDLEGMLRRFDSARVAYLKADQEIRIARIAARLQAQRKWWEALDKEGRP